MNCTLSRTLLILALGSTALVPHLAAAADGTITFNGEITTTSCTISGSGAASGTGNITVQMPTVSSSALGPANSVAGKIPFQLVLGGGTSCTNGKTAAMWVEVGATPDLNTTTNNLKNHFAGGSNVEVQLVNPSNNQQILLGTNNLVTNGSTVVAGSNQPAATIANGTATLNYIAQYQNVGAVDSVTAGKVQAMLTYSMQYN